MDEKTRIHQMKYPVAIGGVGGSGTRVLAQILHDSGFYMGGHLNEAYDNLWFTLLLRRPKWLEQARDKNIQFAIRIFDEAMNGRLKPTFQQQIFMLKAVTEYIRRRYIRRDDWRSLPISIFKSLKKSKDIPLEKYSRWGWKEPNTHLFLEQVVQFYPSIKYIHCIRHGLDMAFSTNQIQLRNFGKRYGVEYPSDILKLPYASLEFWIRSNRKVIDTASSLLGSNFKLVNFETLCANPKDEIKALLDFADVKVSEEAFQTFCTIPKMPQSSGRYRIKGISAFSKEQLQAVEKMGYSISM